MPGSMATTDSAAMITTIIVVKTIADNHENAPGCRQNDGSFLPCAKKCAMSYLGGE